ncbi:MAG: ABC-F family ATP-binding cassette domain-containing protein [Patescibacteria group bacterium]
MIRGNGVTKAFADTVLLDKVDFLVGEGKKIGLVGRNGCGKTTLLKMIVGEEELTAGSIDREGDRIAYIPQEFTFPDTAVGDYLESKLVNGWDFYIYKYKVDQFAAKLNFEDFDPKQRLLTLSEGQKMKVKLIETLLADPSTILIDEPTNHLDIEGIMWFEDYVKNLAISVLMISHDRSFLNHTVDEIWEIDKLQIFKFVGNYDFYKEEKLKLINKWNQDFVLFLKRKEKLDNLLELSRKIGKGVAAVHKRIEREVENNTKEKYTSKKIKEVDFNTDVNSGKLMLRFSDVSKLYNEKKVFDHLNFELRGREKVWLYGPNGAGKSTLIKMIVGEEKATSGEIKVGDNIKIGYFSQVQTHLNLKKSVMDEYTEQTGCYFAQAYAHLNRFLFDRDSIKKRVAQLSPGERARLAFAIFAYKDYDMLILDEPDNHLDIETKVVLEKSLRDYRGTLLLVSHDRYFIESIGIEKMYNLREGAISYLSL